MSTIPIFLAQQPNALQLVKSPWSRASGSGRELLIIILAVASVTLLLLLWATFIRKRPRHHLSRWVIEEATPADPENGHKRRKWRRRRRGHRPRNPTLAETGGLPPARVEQPPESTA